MLEFSGAYQGIRVFQSYHNLNAFANQADILSPTFPSSCISNIAFAICVAVMCGMVDVEDT
jgi:hypothetical protein